MPREKFDRLHTEADGVITHSKAPQKGRSISQAEIDAIKAARPVPKSRRGQAPDGGRDDRMRMVAAKIKELETRIDGLSQRLEQVIDAAYVTEIEGVE
jgi:hypothetical protein